MEQTALDARVRPDDTAALARPGEPSDTVRGSGDAQHEGRPSPRALALREEPCKHMPSRSGDERHSVAGNPDAAQEDDVADLAGIGRDGPYPSELARAASECAPLSGHVLLLILGEKPREELIEALGSVIDLAHGRRTASRSPEAELIR